MKLLLQACCADCTIRFVESTKDEINTEEITIYYFNPNIHPRSEYQSRLKAMQMMCDKYGIKLIVPDWQPSDYFRRVTDTKYPNRCEICWDLRIEKSIEYAKNNGFDSFSTTLLSSEYQNTKRIEEIVKNKGIKFEQNVFITKKIDKTIKTSGFYKQFFCGCVYSMKERMEEKYRATHILRS